MEPALEPVGHARRRSRRPSTRGTSGAGRRPPNRNARAPRAADGRYPSAVPCEPRIDPSITTCQVVPMKVGVAKETAPGERRVALVPEALGKLHGRRARDPRRARRRRRRRHPRQAYTDAGATVVSTDDLYGQSRRRPPGPEAVGRRGRRDCAGPGGPRPPPAADRPAARRRRSPTPGVTAISLDAIPRTLSRAQTMDALSSQANVGGYKAVLIAANAYRPLLPAADHRGRHGQARQRPDPRDRRRRAPGDRHGPPPRRGRSRRTTSGPRRASRPRASAPSS